MRKLASGNQISLIDGAWCSVASAADAQADVTVQKSKRLTRLSCREPCSPSRRPRLQLPPPRAASLVPWPRLFHHVLVQEFDLPVGALPRVPFRAAGGRPAGLRPWPHSRWLGLE